MTLSRASCTVTRFPSACLASCSHSDNSNPMTSQTTGPRAHQERISKRTLRQTAAIWQRSELVTLAICSLYLPKTTASTLKRQANYPLVWRHFLFFITVLLNTGSHSTTVPHPSPSSSSANSRKARIARPRPNSRSEIPVTTKSPPYWRTGKPRSPAWLAPPPFSDCWQPSACSVKRLKSVMGFSGSLRLLGVLPSTCHVDR